MPPSAVIPERDLLFSASENTRACDEPAPPQPPLPKSYSEAEVHELGVDPKSDGGWIKAFPNGILLDASTHCVMHDSKGWTERIAADGTPVLSPHKRIRVLKNCLLTHIAVLLIHKGLPPDVRRTSCDHVGQEGNPSKLDHVHGLDWASPGEQSKRAPAHPTRKARRKQELHVEGAVHEEFRRLVLPNGRSSPTTEMGTLGTVRRLNKIFAPLFKTPKGYLCFTADGQTLRFHRAYMLTFQPLNEGVDASKMVVRHLEPMCGNDSLVECLRRSLPPNICWGTHAQNMADMRPATRAALHAKTVCARCRAPRPRPPFRCAHLHRRCLASRAVLSGCGYQ